MPRPYGCLAGERVVIDEVLSEGPMRQSGQDTEER